MFEELRSELTLSARDYINEADNAEKATDGLADSTEQLDEKASSSGSGLSDLRAGIGKMGAAAAGVGAIGIGAAIKTFGDFDASMQESVAIMGDVSAAEREKLEQTARDVATSTTKSHTQAAESYYYLASAGLDATESMEAMPEVAAFAEAGAMDMAQATDVATDTMSAFGYEAENLSTVTDTMTATVNRHNQTMEGLGSAMSQVAPVASGLGLSIQETSAALGIMGDVGIKAEKAGTGLRSALSSLANPVGATKETINELGINVRDSEGNMRSLTNIIGQLETKGASTADVMALFGNEAGPAMQALLDQGSSALKQETKQLKNAEGATRRVAKAQKQTLNKQLQILKSRVIDVAVATGEYFEPALINVVGAIKRGVNWFSKLNNATSGVAGAAVLIGTVIGGVATAFAAFWPVIASTAEVLTAALGPALAGVGTALSALFGPIGLVVAAMIGLVAIFSGKLPQILTIVDRVFAQLPGIINRAINAAISWITNTGIPMARKAIRTMAKRAAAAIELLSKWLPPRIRLAIQLLSQWIRTKGVPMTKQALTFLAKQSATAFKWLQTNLPPLIRKVINMAISWLRSTGIPLAKKAFRFLVKQAGATFQWLQTNLPPLIKKAINMAINWVQSTGIPLAKNAFRTYINTVFRIWGEIADRLPPLLKKGLNMAITWVRENGPGIAKNAFKLVGKGIRTVVLGLLGAGGILIGLFKDFFGIVGRYLKNDAKGDLKTAAKVAFDALVAAGKAALNALTPPDGIIVQILGDIVSYLKNDAPGDLKAAAEFLFDVVIAAAEGLWDGLIGNSVIKDMVGDVVSYFRTGAWSDLKSAAGKMFDGVISAAGNFAMDFVDVVKQAGADAANGLIDTFNSIIPDSIPMPSTTIDAGSVMGQDLGSITIGGGGPIKLPQLASGGFIEKDGLAMLHAGERVVPMAKVNRDGKGGGQTITINVDARGSDNSRATKRRAKKGAAAALTAYNIRR